MQLIKRYLFLIIVASGANLFSQLNPNLDFEQSTAGTYTAANAVSGWTLSHQTTTGCPTSTLWSPGSPEFSIVSTPVFSVPFIGTVTASPFGNNVAQLNNFTANSSVTKLSRTIVPTSTANILNILYSGVIEDYSGHSCCEKASLIILLKSNNVELPCMTYTISPGCSSTPFTSSGNTSFTGWKMHTYNLSFYSYSTLTLEVIVRDCSCVLHFASFFIDTEMTTSPLVGTGIGTGGPPQLLPVEFCSGSNVAKITALSGFTNYQWIAPSGTVAPPNGTNQQLVIMNPQPGSVYTVSATGLNGCMYVMTATLVFSNVSVSSVQSSNSCSGGSSGSASVVAAGSASGYTYTWVNSNSITVGTNSTVSGLQPGPYKVTVTSAAGCGTGVATVTIGTRSTKLISIVKPYCGNEAFLIPPPGAGYQWYNNNQPIPPKAWGTSSALTISTPSAGAIYAVTYSTSEGCNDSIVYTLQPTVAGVIATSYNKLICPGGTNGQAIISMTPAIGTAPGSYSFGVTNSDSNTAVYNASVAAAVAAQFTVGSLHALGNYMVNAFDGACKYSTSFSVSAHTWTFNLTPVSSTLCNTGSVQAGVQFPLNSGAGSCTYSWSPTTFLVGKNGTLPNTIITPTTVPGSTLSMIYTVAVTPIISGCTMSKTLQVVTANLVTPTITPVAPVCRTSSAFTIDVTPAGGSFFMYPQYISSQGVVNPINFNAGTYAFTYATQFGTCSASSSSTLQIKDFNLALHGNLQICAGQSTTLFATAGATSYSWSTGSSVDSTVVSPLVNTSFTVSAYDKKTGCTNSADIAVYVYTVPVLSVTGPTAICFGDSLKLKVSGANSYTWNSLFSGNTFTTVPVGSAIYFVTGVNYYPLLCRSSSSVHVQVNPLPKLHFAGTFVKCLGDEGNITVYGASTYTWNNNYYQASYPFVFKPDAVTFTVTGVDAEGCSKTSVVTVSVETCTGINETTISGLKIYPNPTNGSFTIETNSDHEKSIMVYDVSGRVLREEQVQFREVSIDLTVMAAGFYFVKVQVGEKIEILRIVKN